MTPALLPPELQAPAVRRLTAAERAARLCARRYGSDAVVGGSSPEAIVRALSTDLCTSLVKAAFPATEVRRHACAAGCGEAATERCHGVPRPELLLRAARALWPRAERAAAAERRLLPLADLAAAFLQLHGDPAAGFCFKCSACHAAERRGGASGKHEP
jgi:hypothetical protein